MSVAHAERQLANLLLVELMAALAEDADHAHDENADPEPAVATPEPVAAAA